MTHGTVVVGASLAGLCAAEALRMRGYEQPIAIVGAESYLPYDRPPLSKSFLAADASPDIPFLRGGERFKELEIEAHLGVSATSLDVAANRVRLDDGEDLPFDQLIIATGAAARRAPVQGNMHGFHTLRTLDDARALRTDLDRATNVVVMGGGFIGAEVAVAARNRGLNVAMVEMLPAPMSRGLGEQAGNLLARMHLDNGVHVHCGVTIEAALGNGRVEGVRLSDGTRLDADLVVVGLGVTPNTKWLEGSGLDIEDGVACDATLHAVGHENIFAVGDVARWPNPVFAQMMRIEHWTNANDHAEVVASQIIGTGKVADAIPYVWSDQYGRRIQIVGRPAATDVVTVLEDPIDGKHAAVYERAGRVVGMLTIDSPRNMMKGRKAIGTPTSAVDLIASF